MKNVPGTFRFKRSSPGTIIAWRMRRAGAFLSESRFLRFYKAICSSSFETQRRIPKAKPLVYSL